MLIGETTVLQNKKNTTEYSTYLTKYVLKSLYITFYHKGKRTFLFLQNQCKFLADEQS